MTITALEVTRKAAWFVHYAPGHWSLNLCNIYHGLPEPYTISKVRRGYTVMMNEERIGTFATFEDAIVGAYQHMDEEAGKNLFGTGGYEGEHTAHRVEDSQCLSIS